MREKIKISAVSYLNTLPFIYGIEHSPLIDEIELSRDYPSLCAKRLINKEVQLGLIPVAEISKIQDPQIVSKYCIGAEGKVNTVALFSNCPMEDIHTIMLDYQSRTSVNLLKILLRDYWKKDIQLVATEAGYEKKIISNTAGLVIGDRVFSLAGQYLFQYDLSEIWLKHTGLPFVFAAWVSNCRLPESFIHAFNAALKYGLDHRNRVIEQFKKDQPDSQVNIEQYLMQDIRYCLDEDKRKGMALFLEMMKGN